MRRRRIKRQRWSVARQRRLEDERRRRHDKWGTASCDNQMAMKRSRQSCKAEAAAARQQGQRDNQLANKMQTGEVYKRQTGGEASADKRRRSTKRTRGGGGAT